MLGMRNSQVWVGSEREFMEFIPGQQTTVNARVYGQLTFNLLLDCDRKWTAERLFKQFQTLGMTDF
jgi:hypothetical protein